MKPCTNEEMLAVIILLCGFAVCAYFAGRFDGRLAQQKDLQRPNTKNDRREPGHDRRIHSEETP